jgi:hypothetical protein
MGKKPYLFQQRWVGLIGQIIIKPIQGNKTMKNIIRTIVAALPLSFTASAEVGVRQSTAILGRSGPIPFEYVDDVSLFTPGNPKWSGYNFVGPRDFGAFNPSAGDSLVLNNFYFRNYAFIGGANGKSFNPSNHQQSTSPVMDAGTNHNYIAASDTATFKLFRSNHGATVTSNLLYQASMRRTGGSGDTVFWDLGPSNLNINLFSGIGNGTYSLTWTIDYTYTSQYPTLNTHEYPNSMRASPALTSGNFGIATFGIVPEPSALSLLAVGLGGLAMMRRRRL